MRSFTSLSLSFFFGKNIVSVHLSHVLRHFSNVWLYATLRTAAHQAPPSMGFSKQEHWSGLPCPPPGDLPNPGIELGSLALQAVSLPSEPPRKPRWIWVGLNPTWLVPLKEENLDMNLEIQKGDYHMGTETEIKCLRLTATERIKEVFFYGGSGRNMAFPTSWFWASSL